MKVKKRKGTGQPHQVADHLLKRNFHAEKPLQKLVTDITYLPFGSKMLYLSSIMDLYNGEIIAYSIGDKQGTSLVIYNIESVASSDKLHVT
ncbi:transposase InsO family protein [Brevibacillus aydinogluensis]|nr:transposase InsO family protein [Brevibacillus aydinogluensis]